MADFPALPLWTDAYIADTAHLTNEEHGAYLRLLMIAWRSPTCSLPDDDKRLALMVGVSPKKWRALRGIIAAFWTIENGVWTQKRLTRERDFVRGKSEKNRNAAETRWQGKSLKNNNPDNADASSGHMPERYVNDAPIPTPTPSKKEDGGDGMREPEISQPPSEGLTFRERILAACGVDPVSGITGRGGNLLGTQADMMVAHKWRAELGLTEAEIIAEITEVIARKTDGPPSRFNYFTSAMQRLSGAKAAEELQPTRGAENGSTRSRAGGDRLRNIIAAAAAGSTDRP